MTLSYADVIKITGGRLGIYDASCPLCSPTHNPRRKVLRVWQKEIGFAGFNCARCGTSGWAKDQLSPRTAGVKRRSVHAPAVVAKTVVDRDDSERIAIALQIFDEAETCHPAILAYFGRRFVEPPDEAFGETIRFHPNCPFAGTRTPAMVCLVRDIRTDAPKAIHRTVLTLDGDKVRVGANDRLTLAPIRGGAIKLTPDVEVTTCLGVGEGIESTLSLRNLPEFGPSPVWSLISAGGVKRFPVLGGVESLWIAVDNDKNGTGQRDSRAAALRWQTSGAEVFLKTPSAPGADLNDLF